MIVDIENISRDELETLLIDNVCYIGETSETRTNLKKYYSLLSMDDLRKKASQFFNDKLVKQPVVKLDVRELKREELRLARERKEAHWHTKIKEVRIPYTDCRSPQNKLVDILMCKPYVKAALSICEGNIAVSFIDKPFKKAVKKLCDELKYEGTVHYYYG